MTESGRESVSAIVSKAAYAKKICLEVVGWLSVFSDVSCIEKPLYINQRSLFSFYTYYSVIAHFIQLIDHVISGIRTDPNSGDRGHAASSLRTS